MIHFTKLTPEDIGILEDAQSDLLNPDDMSPRVAQRVYYLWLEGYLSGISITPKGKEILKSFTKFKESLK